jgi:hypothetical protein
MRSYPNEHERERLREKYKPETRVRLVSMNDPYTALPLGLKGTVLMVDDTGTIHIQWDNGSTLGALYGIDRVEIITEGGGEK